MNLICKHAQPVFCIDCFSIFYHCQLKLEFDAKSTNFTTGISRYMQCPRKRSKLAYKAKKLILIDIESKRGTIHHLLIMNCPRRDQWIRKNNKMNCDVKTMFYICALIRHWPIDRNIFWLSIQLNLGSINTLHLIS